MTRARQANNNSHFRPRVCFRKAPWAGMQHTCNENESIAHHFLSSCFGIGTRGASNATVASAV
jgi:hypothetical protein